MNCSNNKPVCVYAIRCNGNGKVYIGSTIDLENRIKTHFRELFYGTKKNSTTKGSTIGMRSKNFLSDFKKYGFDGFDVFVLKENIPGEHRSAYESCYINAFDSMNPEHGYNSTTEFRKNPKYHISKAKKISVCRYEFLGKYESKKERM